MPNFVVISSENNFFFLKVRLPTQIITSSIRIISALNGRDGAYSLQSVERPEHYLRHRNFLVHLDASDGSELFKNDASFFMRANKYFPGYTSLESCNFPGHFLRHQNYKMKLHKEDSSQLFKMDASFLSSSVCKLC